MYAPALLCLALLCPEHSFANDIESLSGRALVEILRAPSHPQAELAAWVLGERGAKSALAVPALVEALEDRRPAVRAAAIWALGRVRSRAKRVVPRLSRLMLEGEAGERPIAARALAAFGEKAASETPALALALADGSSEVRQAVLGVVAQVGRPARPLEPKVVALLKDDDRDVRAAAARALAGIHGGASCLQPLGAAARDSDPFVRLSSVRAIGVVATNRGQGVGYLVDSLSDDDPRVRRAGRESLRRVGRRLQRSGTNLWWVVPLAHRTEGVLILVVLALWLCVAKRSRAALLKRLGARATFFVFLVPTAVVGVGGVCWATSAEWTNFFLPPGPPLLSFRASACLTVVFLACMGSAWLTSRDPSA